VNLGGTRVARLPKSRGPLSLVPGPDGPSMDNIDLGLNIMKETSGRRTDVEEQDRGTDDNQRRSPSHISARPVGGCRFRCFSRRRGLSCASMALQLITRGMNKMSITRATATSFQHEGMARLAVSGEACCNQRESKPIEMAVKPAMQRMQRVLSHHGKVVWSPSVTGSFMQSQLDGSFVTGHLHIDTEGTSPAQRRTARTNPLMDSEQQRPSERPPGT